jgi:hypothetical protein
MNVASQLIGTSNAAEAQTVHVAEGKEGFSERTKELINRTYFVIGIMLASDQWL